MEPILGSVPADVVNVAESLAASPWFYAVLFLAVAIDALIPLVPGEVILTTGGTLVATRSWGSLVVVVALGASGALTGDLMSYWVGRRGRSLTNRLRPEGRTASVLATVSERINRGGTAVLVGARFVPGGRTAATLAAGCAGLPLRRFTFVSAGSAIAWSAYTTLLGIAGGVAFSSNPAIGAAMGVILGVGIGAATQLTRRAAPEPLPYANPPHPAHLRSRLSIDRRSPHG